MAELECPMQTKAFNIFWHKAELRLVEQAEPEAPVFAISRPTLFGGHEEFLLQYPARLDPPTDRDITRHRFTVRHGKKRRSFQAPDAATFDTWLSALEQALEPKRESEQFHTPSSVATTATTSTAGSNGTNSQGRGSNAGLSSDTRASSQGRTSNPTSKRSHFSQPRAPALRLTLERPCFTRDPSNLKLIRLHRPAATIAEAEEADDDVLDVPDTDTEIEDEPEEEMTEESENEDVYGSVIADEALTDEPLDVAGDNSSNGDNHSDLAEITANAGDLHDDVTLCFATEGQNDIDLAVKVVLNEAEEIETEVKLAVDALVAAVMDNTEVEASSVQTVTAPAPRSFTKEPAPKSSSRPATLASRYKWVPLDPNSSRLIWVRCSVETDVKSAPRSNPRRKGAKPARRWVPIDPNSTRPIWIRRAESSAVRMESRYKATSNARKWVPLDPDNSRFIWVRHHVASGKQHRH